MQIQLNGKSHEVAEASTVADLIAQLEMQPKYVAVECNRELVPRAQHANHRLVAGDEVEIVTLVGGG